jgi:TolB-like protein
MSFIEELKRRNVVKIGVLYIVAAWLTLQVAELLFDALELPSAWLRLVLALVILGFPIALIFSWVFELTPEGIKREKDVDRSRSVTGETGRKINTLIVVLLVIAIGTVAVDRLVPEQAEPVAQAPAPAPVATSPAEVPGETTAEAPAGPPDRSIAVLPFANMSGDVENEYFADGLSEEILNFLAGVPDLQVTARTSSFQFKGKNADVREIGGALNVANVLEGSVRRAGDQARITAQLIRASDGYHLWSATYDRQMDDVFEIQTEIAESVTRALGVVLDDAQRQQMIDAGVREVDAFVYYQRGLEKFWKAHGEHFDLAMMAEAAELFGEAIRIEPDFADAYFMRSDYYAHLTTTPGLDEAERKAAFAS